MTTAFVAVALAVLAFILIVLVLVGANRDGLGAAPPTPLAGFARVLGVYVRKDIDSEPTPVTPLVNGRR